MTGRAVLWSKTDPRRRGSIGFLTKTDKSAEKSATTTGKSIKRPPFYFEQPVFARRPQGCQFLLVPDCARNKLPNQAPHSKAALRGA